MKSNKGFALPSVIFLIIMVAGIVTAMAKLMSNQAGSTALSVLGVRADSAAKSGIEWASYQIHTDPSWCGTTTLNLTDVLTGFVVTVQCSARNSYIEGGKTVVMYEVVSTASYGSYATSPDYVYRQISAMLTTES